MKSFKQYLYEKTLWTAGAGTGGLSSNDPTKMSEEERQHQPIWLGHDKRDTRGLYYDYSKLNAHLSTAKVHGKVAHFKDPKIRRLINKHIHEHGNGMYLNELIHHYHTKLSTEPHASVVHNHPVTKILQKHGYVGYTHPDLAMDRDAYNKHLEKHMHPYNTVVFHRKHVTLTPVQRGPHRTGYVNKHSNVNPKNIQGKIANHKDLHDLLHKKYYPDGHIQVDFSASIHDYSDILSKSKTPHSMHSHIFTKLLKTAGFKGFTHKDTTKTDGSTKTAVFNLRHLKNR